MDQYTGFEIAVIGMSGKFPKADNISEFWAHLKEGKDCISTFDLSEALKEGESEALLKNPSYVPARAYLENKEHFDNDFFGYRPDEAELMDPQIRLYHECCWQALEDSGYNPADYKDKIGLFASASPSTNWAIHSFSKNKDGLVNEFTASHLREISFLSTMISYKFNLKGPSIFLQTACSSSLVAIHQACNSLLLGECSMALAGGVSISNYSRRGYVYQTGMILSRDGKCRPFDADSSGTVGGEGAGVVVLKKLQDALRDRDHIYAVVKGTGINNDGNSKAGYTAPSVKGQAEAIRKAHRMAGVSAESISYVEAHGTGTELGDPIEIAALNEVFGKSGRPAESCAIGSAKSNIGHLDAAAGVAGFIKTVLSLKHKVLPASLHYELANPRIDFASGPFYVNSSLREWVGKGKPLRAGVSSFGIGGTNAHVVLEEAPLVKAAAAGRRDYLLVLSAKSASSLDRYCARLCEYLKDQEDISMADLSYTLQQGRVRFPYRKVVVCRDRADAIEQLGTSGGIYEGSETAESLQHIVFMFPGQGSQYREMCAGLYQRERVFRETLDECLSLSARYSDLDFRAALFVTDSGVDINRTEYAQPLLFMVEYSLSQLLIFWGLRPDYMIGHSIGEYVAACISGVFSLSDALRLVVRRGELMGSVREGRMLSVSMGAEELRPLLSGHPGVDLSVINSPFSVVVGGELSAVDAFSEWLSAQGHSCKALHTSHAFHSSMMSAILDRFEQEFSTVEIHAPRIAYVSSMSGELVSYEELTKPAYWSSHLREPVNFFGGASRLLREGGAVLIEVGAGRSLCNYIQESGLLESGHHPVNLVRQFGQQVSDEFYLAGKLGELWLKGCRFHWDNYYSDECRGRISVPGYCFEQTRYTSDVDSRKLLRGPGSFVGAVAAEKEEVVGHVSGWHRSESPNAAFELNQRQTCVVFSDTHGFGAGLKGYLESHGQHVIDGDLESMDELWAKLSAHGTVVHQIIYCLALSEGVGEVGYGSVSDSLEPGYLGLCRLGKSLSGIGQVDKIGVTVLGNHLARVLEGDKVNPLKSTVIGAVKVLPSEMHQISCKVIDISYPFGSLSEEAACQEQIVNELFYETDRAYVAYRGKERWVPVYQALKIDSRLHSGVGIRPGGVYIVTGGFGGMGFTLCRSLVEDHGAVVILVYRSFFPARSDWDSWLSVHGPDDPASAPIRELLELESGGGRIDLYQLDVGSETEVSVFSDQIREHYGQIHGLIWAAGEVDYGGIVLNRKEEDFRRYLSSKVDGVLLFEQYLDFGSMDFISLFSSIGNVFYQSKFGQVGYNAANEFMEGYAVYARERFKGHVFTVNWCDWYDVGMTVKTLERKYPGTDITGLNGHIESGIYPAEGLAAFYNCLSRKPSVFTIYKGNLDEAVVAHREAYEHRKAGLGVVDAGTSFSGDSIEDRLRQIFVHFFGKTGISSKDNFFELGGDSLKGMTLIGRINQEIGCQLTIGDLYRCPDIGELAGELESRQGKVRVHIPRLEIQQSYVLSSAQQRMYFLQQLEGAGSTLYNETQLFWLHGELDKEKLEETFRGLIGQHESLRTGFVLLGGELRQLILDEFDFRLEHYQCADSEVQL
ncbi:beta-ketoacyl synthase N-terminal-like domain-containing protein, partial [Pedobacter psychrotolerans]|uniref:type I polyketide synthase n=1 Tax=Pedobacter psychrotolerans TaxID=1843235 RepID=UPI003F975757